jgi:Permuted papain-like amidase enzyme, YaeF/YiiX, C92 family
MKRYLVALGFGVAALAAVAGTSLAVSPPVPQAAVPPSAQTAAPVTWPMPVEDFLAGGYLQRADVVLTRRSGSLSSWLIRWSTNSPFSHAALVFTGPQFESGFTNTFVIEAGTSGVDLTDLRDYIADKSTYLAVKRIKRPWFDEPKQSRVRGLLLDKIKATYDYWAVGQLARNLWFGVERSVRGDKPTLESFQQRDWDAPNEYICSGLVQLGFFEAVMEYIKADELPGSVLSQVVFDKQASAYLPQTEEDWSYVDREQAKSMAVLFYKQQHLRFNSVTPENLAASDKLEWLYFIKDGLVYKVSTYDEVRKLIGE